MLSGPPSATITAPLRYELAGAYKQSGVTWGSGLVSPTTSNPVYSLDTGLLVVEKRNFRSLVTPDCLYPAEGAAAGRLSRFG